MSITFTVHLIEKEEPMIVVSGLNETKMTAKGYHIFIIKSKYKNLNINKYMSATSMAMGIFTESVLRNVFNTSGSNHFDIL